MGRNYETARNNYERNYVTLINEVVIFCETMKHGEIRNFDFEKQMGYARHPPDAADDDQHDGEGDRGGGVGLDDPEPHQGEQLDDGEEVDPLDGHVLEVHVVGLVLSGYEQEAEPVEKLQPYEKRFFPKDPA